VTGDAGEPPPEVAELADRRSAARSERDFIAADALRERIRAAGWDVSDTADGFTLQLLLRYRVLLSVADLPDRSADAPVRACSIGLLFDGWPDDARRCVEAVLAHAPADVVVIGLDTGNVDGAGDALHDLAVAHPGRVEEWHVALTADELGWGPARTALLQLDPARVHVVMDVSTVLDGDAISPLLQALADTPDAVAVGWRGALVDADDQWRSVHEAGAGEVDVLLSYLFAVYRGAALAAPPHAKARFYRNADIEWSLALREAAGRLYVVGDGLPCHQERHHGYEDRDPDYRERESKRTYDRLLRRFRAKGGILTTRPDPYHPPGSTPPRPPPPRPR
jgi:hypothetical protein